jgi:hypothetical protein
MFPHLQPAAGGACAGSHIFPQMKMTNVGLGAPPKCGLPTFHIYHIFPHICGPARRRGSWINKKTLKSERSTHRDS